jgi:hypothetical protein
MSMHVGPRAGWRLFWQSGRSAEARALESRLDSGRRLRIEPLEPRELLATIQASPIGETEVYGFECVAKAQPDEWYTGTFDAEGNYVPGPYYALGEQPDDVVGREKVNQDYVWGMTAANGLVYFSSAGNVLTLATLGLVGASGVQITEVHVAEGAQSQYPINVSEELLAYLGDWRPSQMHVYDPATDTYTNITPDDELLDSTLGLRSAGTANGVVLFAGPDLTYQGMNVFAFNAETQEYLGSKHLALYNDIRNWAAVGERLYAGVAVTYSTTGEGAILMWNGSVRNPFNFTEIVRLDLNAASLVVHDNRLFVGTWPMSAGSLMGYLGYDSTATPGIWMSPELTADGRIRAGAWEKVWEVTDYEVDAVIAQSEGLGAMCSFDGYLYWGTMQVPGTGTQAILEAYPDYAGDMFTIGMQSSRAAAVFRCNDFDTDSPDVQLLYGDSQLYTFIPPTDMSLPGAWVLKDNNTGKALFGESGFDNNGNCYIWSMAVYNERLYVGTLDRDTTRASERYLQYGGDIVAMEADQTEMWMGADLWCFFPDTESGDPVRPFVVDKTGVGNPLNHGVRNMVVTSDGLFLGTANCSNLLTANDNAARYPGLSLEAGGWELVRVDIGTSAGSIPFTLSGTTVSEGITSNTVVGTLAVTNPEAGNSYTFTLVDNAAGRFEISGNQLIALADNSSKPPRPGPARQANYCDYETMDSHGIVVRVSDASGRITNQVFTITVTDAAEKPARIDLSGLWVYESSAPGTRIGTVTSFDQDAGDAVTLSLRDDAGGCFRLVGGELQVNNGALLDYETAPTQTVIVRATDTLGQFRETSFTIYLMNVNEAPTALVLSAATVEEGSPTGVLVGTLAATDPDAADSLTYTLVDDAGGRFQLVNNQLQVADGTLLNYDQATSHAVTASVTDAGGLSYVQTFTVTVSEAAVPTLLSMDVQDGATQRSFVRYVDLVFASSGDLANVVADSRVQLRRYKLNSTGGTAVSLYGRVTATENQLCLDFGTSGLAIDGYYELSLDLDNDAVFETVRHFYRLQGDVNGDRTVDALDRAMVVAALGQTGENLEADVNGDGVVNRRDRNLVYRANGTLNGDLPLDD